MESLKLIVICLLAAMLHHGNAREISGVGRGSMVNKRTPTEEIADPGCGVGGRDCAASQEMVNGESSELTDNWMDWLNGWGKRSSKRNGLSGWGKRSAAPASSSNGYDGEKATCSDILDTIRYHLEQVQKYKQLLQVGDCRSEKDIFNEIINQ